MKATHTSLSMTQVSESEWTNRRSAEIGCSVSSTFPSATPLSKEPEMHKHTRLVLLMHMTIWQVNIPLLTCHNWLEKNVKNLLWSSSWICMFLLLRSACVKESLPLYLYEWSIFIHVHITQLQSSCIPLDLGETFLKQSLELLFQCVSAWQTGMSCFSA